MSKNTEQTEQVTTEPRGAGSDVDAVVSDLEPFERRAESVMYAVFGGEHHWPKVISTPRYWVMNVRGSFATYDDDRLTRLVISAHRHCVRAEVAPSGPGMIKIYIHRRKGRTGRMHERHPTIEQAIADHGR